MLVLTRLFYSTYYTSHKIIHLKRASAKFVLFCISTRIITCFIVKSFKWSMHTK